MPTTKKYIVELRNATIIWLIVALMLLGGLWFSYNFFSTL